jgi:opacity protein-like surface antigen
MKNFRKAIVVAAALTMGQSATASAADLLPPPPVMEPLPIPEPVAVRDIYLRGYIGMTEQEADDFTNDIIAAGNFTIFNKEFDSSPFIGFGVGIRRSDRFRFDATGEFRGKATFHGLDRDNTAATSNDYSGVKSEWLFLANGYIDLGTHRGFTPYVGAGIGTAEVTLDNFTDVNENTGGIHWAEKNSEWNFAWALHAGFAYEISPDLTFDMGYRYTYLGDGKTGSFRTYDGTPSPSPLILEDLTSHDVHIGLRWALGSDSCCASEVMPISYK